MYLGEGVWYDMGTDTKIAGMAHGMMEDSVTNKQSQKMTLQNLKQNHIITYLYLVLSNRCSMRAGKPNF